MYYKHHSIDATSSICCAILNTPLTPTTHVVGYLRTTALCYGHLIPLQEQYLLAHVAHGHSTTNLTTREVSISNCSRRPHHNKFHIQEQYLQALVVADGHSTTNPTTREVSPSTCCSRWLSSPAAWPPTGSG